MILYLAVANFYASMCKWMLPLQLLALRVVHYCVHVLWTSKPWYIPKCYQLCPAFSCILKLLQVFITGAYNYTVHQPDLPLFNKGKTLLKLAMLNCRVSAHFMNTRIKKLHVYIMIANCVDVCLSYITVCDTQQ